MNAESILLGKRVLIVDDEPDILEALVELLEPCFTEAVSDFNTAARLLKNISYDAAILDIMGVDGYELLKMATQRHIPTLMLTAHALTPDHLVASIEGGAYAYIPKDRMLEIEVYLSGLIKETQNGDKKGGAWFRKLLPFFDKKFGENWKKTRQGFLNRFL